MNGDVLIIVAFILLREQSHVVDTCADWEPAVSLLTRSRVWSRLQYHVSHV